MSNGRCRTPAFETLRLAVDDGVATLTLCRPDKRNALNLQMCLDLAAAADAIAREPSVRVVVIAADGPVFSAGADLKEREGKPAAWVSERRARAYAAYAALAALEMPVVAIVDGPCVGSGCEIAATADIILASERASFRYPEAQWGSVGATQRLPRLVGPSVAKELQFTGRTVGAEEARAIGLVTRVVATDRAMAEATGLARQIAKAPPLAIRLAKRCIDHGMETTLAAGIEIERQAVEESLASSEWQAGVAAFADRGGASRG